MFDNRFSPRHITFPAGGKVTFRGVGRNPYNAVAVDKSWSTEDVVCSLEQFEGDDATLTLTHPANGCFNARCCGSGFVT